MNLWWDYLALWQSSMLKLMGQTSAPVAEPAKGDKRFRHEDWQEHFLFDYIKQSYLIAARWLHDAVASVEGLDEHTQKKVDFFTRQYIDALAPSNFALTNPEVFRETIATRRPEPGQGPEQPARRHRARQRPAQDLDDRQQGVRARRQHRDHAGQGRLPERPDAADPVRADDEEGLQAAAADHSAVDQQVLHPRPAREELARQVVRRAGPHRVRDLVGQSRTSSSPARISTTTCSKARSRRSTRSRRRPARSEINALGYCLGGTLLAATLGYLAAKKDQRIVSASFMTSLIDFTGAGELEVFIDEEQVAGAREAR